MRFTVTHVGVSIFQEGLVIKLLIPAANFKTMPQKKRILDALKQHKDDLTLSIPNPK